MMMNQSQMNQQTAGIEKRMTWKLLFFVAACCTLAAGVISVVCLLFTFPPAPMSFLSEAFLLVFGVIMVVLDLPFMATSSHVNVVRDSIYKYMLFLTRFTGRGLWYCFLGTMIWAALWDLNISWFLGFILGLYVILAGIIAMLYGLKLSMKLDSVRKIINDKDVQAPICPEKGFSKQAFLDVTNSVNQTKFNDDEIDYIVNALSFQPENNEIVTKSEYTYWLSPGLMSIV